MGKNFKKRFRNRQRKPYGNYNNKNKQKEERDAQFASKKEHELIVKDSLREDQVGITEYINPGEGFKGILKSRFSDFHVNEIDLNGEVLHLNDLSIPEEIEDDFSMEEADSAKEELKKLLPEDVWDKMSKLKEAKLEKYEKPKDSAIILDASELNKEQRTLLHKVIKKLYEKKLISSTATGDGPEADKKRLISVMKSHGRDRNHWTFPGEFVHFLVHKENLDTSEVASVIARKLNLRPSHVNFSGTKDRRAKTTQKFCIKGRAPSQIVGTVKFLSGVAIGNFNFKHKILRLGDLRGNRFRIAIRNLTGERQHIETLLNSMKEKGFVNYFGLQRFGNCSSIPTYEVGVALLKADYKLACELILKPRDNDIPFVKHIREMWWKNRDSKAAAAQFRSDRFIEKKLLDGLAQYGENNYAAALRKIPRNMLILYPHAFQSLIFNKVASKRIQKFGLSLVPGDLVFRSKEQNATESSELEDQEGDNKEAENVLENNGENVSDDETKNEAENEAGSPFYKDKKSKFVRAVKQITEEDIASGAYTIHDVVLPIPGHDVMYPNNVVASWYEEFMKEYQLSSELLKHNIKIFSMNGAYRKLIEKPRDITWEFKTYSTPDETLILSDLEVLQGKKLEDFKKEGCDSKYEALLLDFCLPPSCYATMMLRELLKCDTSTSAQSILQQAAVKEHAVAIEREAKNIEESTGEKRKANDSESEEESNPPKLLKDGEP